jgi:hypothetical protein
MKQSKLDNQINSFLHEYLEFDDKFNSLDDNEKIYVYSILNRLMHSFYTVLKNQNIHPILFVMTPRSKEILDNILFKVSYYIPPVRNIKVKILH